MLWLFNILDEDWKTNENCVIRDLVQLVVVLYNILKKNAAKLERVLPEEIEIKTALVRDPELMEQTDVVFTNNINDIAKDPEIELVVEVMGGITTAYEYVESLLISAKNQL